jgi:hypothetical protein
VGAVAELFQVAEIDRVLTARQFPSVTVWNRLEGRPRTVAFDRALRAEVRDALWMLSRQWQLGELHGEDAGSPVLAKLHIERTELTRYRPGEHDPEPFDAAIPLEAEVERRPVRFGLDVRLAMGRYWLKLIAGVGDFRTKYLDQYSIKEPDPEDEDDADRAAHPEVWQAYAAVAGRAMDGGDLLAHLRRGSTARASDDITDVQPDAGALDAAGDRFLAWAERVFLEPPRTGEDAWTPERMEYRFATSAPGGGGERVMAAEEYHGGRLDWYSVDVDPNASTLDPLGEKVEGLPDATTFTAMPTSVEFDGMPNARWWAFEDGRTNLGKVDAATTDVAKLLFLEFGLVYSNDWLVIPCLLAAGSVATIGGMAITNVFGERTWIEPASRGPDDDWQRWSMYTLSVAGRGPEEADRSLLLLPTVPKLQEGDPVEEVLLVHDEMANMAWGVEQTVPLPSGDSRPGAEVGRETLAHHQRLRGSAPLPLPFETDAKIRYEAMTQVPEEWIPFVAVHVPGSDRSIQLQRAGLPRFIEGEAPGTSAVVRPRTALLREGLDGGASLPYFLFEEEVPRSGARVTQSWQRTRWRDGRVVLWLGARKGIGRPTGASGLAFDQAVDVPPEGA